MVIFAFTLDVVFYWIDIISEISEMLHRGFMQSFIPSFCNAVVTYFETVPDTEIRKLKKKRIADLFSHIEKCLRRIYTVIDKYQFMDSFKLSFCTRLVKSDFLQLRIEGLKFINTIVTNSEKELIHGMNGDLLLDWIKKNKLVEELSGPRKHQQILQRSSPIIKFFYQKSEFSKEILEGLWEFAKDSLLRKDLFNLLNEIGFPLHSAELEYFANKIIEMDPNEIIEEALNVIFESHKNLNRTNEQLIKYADMMAAIAFNENYPLEISESAVKKYAEMVSDLDYDPYKKDILVTYIKTTIMENKNVVMGLKLIRYFLEQFIENATAGIDNTRADVINYLITEANLVQEFFDNFEWYYNNIKGKDEDDIIVDRYNHRMNMIERIDFLSYLLTNCMSTYRLPIKCYYKMWSMMYENPISSDDSDILFIFIKCITASTTFVWFDTNIVCKEF